MSKFRWRKGELDKLDKDINRVNRVIAKLQKQGVENLPEKKNYYKERDTIIANNLDPREYLKELNTEIKIITDKKNTEIVKSERGLKVPLMTKKIYENKVKKINEVRQEKKERYENAIKTDRNIPLPEVNKLDRDLNTNTIRPKNFNFENMSKGDWEMFVKSTEHEFRKDTEKSDLLYRTNYYKSIDSAYSPEQAKELKKILDLIPTDKLVDKYYTDKNMDINFNYLELDQQVKYSISKDAWESYRKENGWEEQEEQEE